MLLLRSTISKIRCSKASCNKSREHLAQGSRSELNRIDVRHSSWLWTFFSPSRSIEETKWKLRISLQGTYRKDGTICGALLVQWEIDHSGQNQGRYLYLAEPSGSRSINLKTLDSERSAMCILLSPALYMGNLVDVFEGYAWTLVFLPTPVYLLPFSLFASTLTCIPGTIWATKLHTAGGAMTQKLIHRTTEFSSRQPSQQREGPATKILSTPPSPWAILSEVP